MPPFPASTPHPWILLPAVLATAALLFGAGCGGDEEGAAPSETAQAAARAPGAEQVTTRAEARAALDASRQRAARQASAVDAASEEVERLRAELESAESRLQVARGAFDTEQRRLAEAQERMRRFAVPDAVLFRNVQRDLLDSAALDDVAIAAEVSQGVVTLRGRVPDERTREAAVEIAEEIDGVISVDDRIEVAGTE